MRHVALVTIALAVSAGSSVPLGAQSKDSDASRAAFEAKLGYQTGTVTLNGGFATIRVPPSFRFVGADGSRRLLTEAWGNPPETAEGVLGMLVPAAVSPLSDNSWAIVISYDEDGYVSDSDAAGMDYGKVLKEMQEGAAAANEEREKQGFDSVKVVGWAEPPSYDAASHKMYWAKDLVFGSSTEHTLNYNIRILGRRGVLVLSAIAAMDRLEAVRTETRNVLAAVDFNEGHRYTDYLPGKDKAAAYGLTGLIVGATAVKAGLFKALWIGILAFKKLIIAGVVALIAAFRRFFGSAPKDTATTESVQQP